MAGGEPTALHLLLSICNGIRNRYPPGHSKLTAPPPGSSILWRNWESLQTKGRNLRKTCAYRTAKSPKQASKAEKY
jgi:hypothetical protein